MKLVTIKLTDGPLAGKTFGPARAPDNWPTNEVQPIRMEMHERRKGGTVKAVGRYNLVQDGDTITATHVPTPYDKEFPPVVLETAPTENTNG